MMWSHIWQGPWLIIIWSIVIALAAWGAAAARRGEGQTVTVASRTPREVARERYARGEITREEYERLIKSLM
jgi:putative membrane protein